MPICLCPKCSRQHKVPGNLLGSKARCTQCRATFTLSAPELAQQPAETTELMVFDDLASQSHSSVTVAPLPSRPALSFVAWLYTFFGFAFSASAVTAVICLVVLELTEKPKEWPISWMVSIPWCFGVFITSIGLVAIGELIRIALGVEVRMHEMSRNNVRLAPTIEKK